MGKKVVQINTVCNTSTGRIMKDIQKKAQESGFDTISFVGRRKIYKDIPCVKFGNLFSFWNHVMITTVFDRQGYGSFFQTRTLIKRLRKEKPDIIHLHNLHGYYLHLPTLFSYLGNEFKGQIFWTFHDCWPITGHCVHFVIKQCEKWKEECYHCPNKKEYPISFFLDSSRKNYKDKKRMFCSLKNLTVIVPSEWMAEQIKQSFFKNYPIKIVHNGIDLNQFIYKRNEVVEKKYGILFNKKILLGVANIWEKRKGMIDFISLADKISEEYIIVLVGLSIKQIRMLPANVIGIQRTDSRDELRAIYSRADIFINPSLEESFSLVTVEAMACGTPVIALDTSAVKDLVNSDNGIILHRHEVVDYIQAIEKIEAMELSREQVRKTVMKYNIENSAEEVVRLYE